MELNTILELIHAGYNYEQIQQLEATTAGAVVAADAKASAAEAEPEPSEQPKEEQKPENSAATHELEALRKQVEDLTAQLHKDNIQNPQPAANIETPETAEQIMERILDRNF